MVLEQHQLVQEEDAQLNFVRHHMESEQGASLQFSEARSEYFHDIHEVNLTEGHRVAAERDRAMFEGRSLLRKDEEQTNTSETWQEKLSAPQKARWTLKASSRTILLD